jgi:hypothetical protein
MPRTRTVDSALLKVRLQASGPASAQTLADGLGVDRLTVQRTLRRLSADVVQLGVTRGTRYAWRRPILTQGATHRIYRMNMEGSIATELAMFTALYGGWRIEWAGITPEWAPMAHDHSGFCEGLPFFLTDLRPQGYLGRAVTRKIPSSLGLPSDPRNWGDDHTVAYLLECGDDLPGNLVLGRSIMAAQTWTQGNAILSSERPMRYPAYAAQADAGDPAGSSVEGEQPKFTVWLREANDASRVRAMLVKFTDRLETPTGRRWADLLAAESLAAGILHATSDADASSPSPEVWDFEGRRFYQLARFDRLGPHGRRGVVSMRALHDAGFTGGDTNEWPVAAAGLQAAGWISAADLDVVRLRHAFGRLIGNTDMHFGNLAFFLDLGLPLRLTPSFDMLPMLWAPRPGSAEPAPEFIPQPPLPEDRVIWTRAAFLAVEYWERVASSAQISESFRVHAEKALVAVRALRLRFG